MTGDDVVFLNTPGGGEPDVALKERGASALERALVFVSNNGDALSQTSAYVALRAEPAVGLAGAVSALQQEGSRPSYSGSRCPFSSTHNARSSSGDRSGCMSARSSAVDEKDQS